MDGDPLPSPQPRQGRGMVTEMQARSPDTEVKDETSPLDIEQCPGGTVGYSAGSTSDEIDEKDPIGVMTKYDDMSGWEQDMSVVNLGDMTGDEKYGMSTLIGGQVKEKAMLLLPSSGRKSQPEKAGRLSTTEEVTPRVNKCVMKKMRCVTHNCVITRVKKKVKGWGYIERKKQFGWKYSSKTKLICSSGNDASRSDSGLARDELTGGISATFGLRGGIINDDLPLEEK